jgi:hypothetical protein
LSSKLIRKNPFSQSRPLRPFPRGNSTLWLMRKSKVDGVGYTLDGVKLGIAALNMQLL